MKHSFLIIAGIPLFFLLLYGNQLRGENAQRQKKEESLVLLDVQKIWDQAPHNAFTDLIRYRDRWYCVFREGSGHVSPDGALRILTSTDGKKWESAALITSSGSDLRDAKITITPEGQLMLSGAAALGDQSKYSHQSMAWFSNDGTTWSDPYPIGDPNYWLWRTTWHNGKAYSMGYHCQTPKNLRLYISEDGKLFETLADTVVHENYPNETSLVFSGDTAFCLLRRDGQPSQNGLIGMAHPPYTKWQWKDLDVRIGGPHMIRLPDGRFLAAVRLYKTGNGPPTRTSLCWINPEAGTLTEALTLPSGGDTSYPGLVFHEGVIWVSYYSSHEEKTSIYLARVKIK